jgi:hypothetical protein
MACPSVIAQVLAAGAYDDGHRGQQDGDASENGAEADLGVCNSNHAHIRRSCRFSKIFWR